MFYVPQPRTCQTEVLSKSTGQVKPPQRRVQLTECEMFFPLLLLLPAYYLTPGCGMVLTPAFSGLTAHTPTGAPKVVAKLTLCRTRLLSRRGHCLFEGFTNETCIRNASRLRAGLHFLQQLPRHAHIDLVVFLLEFKPHGLKLRKIQFRQAAGQKRLRLLIGLKMRNFLSHTGFGAR